MTAKMAFLTKTKNKNKKKQKRRKLKNVHAKHVEYDIIEHFAAFLSTFVPFHGVNSGY